MLTAGPLGLIGFVVRSVYSVFCILYRIMPKPKAARASMSTNSSTVSSTVVLDCFELRSCMICYTSRPIASARARIKAVGLLS